MANTVRRSEAGDAALVERCCALFGEFRQAYAAEWERQDRNERLYRCEREPEEEREAIAPRPSTPLVQSIVENVQADVMDRFPEAVVLPESPEDEEIAEIVGALVAQNHDAQNFRAEYRKMCHDLLLHGWCVSESGFDARAYDGIGMGFIRHVDCRSILFDPEAEDPQDGRAVFKIQPVPVARLEETYPRYRGLFEADAYGADAPADRGVRRDRAKTALLIEYWWREFDPRTQRFRVHIAKVAGHRLLEDSRRSKPQGYLSEGRYPFTVTTMLRRKGSPLGLGFGDEFGAAQILADRLDRIILENAVMASKGKLLVTRASGFDVGDLRDWSREVHEGDSIAGVQWMQLPPLPQHVLSYVERIRQTAREESGANDFTRGTATAGVTAASAITALQEAGGKRSRMIARQLEESFREAVRLEIAFEREYGLFPRCVTVTRDGRRIPVTFDTALLTRVTAAGGKVPAEFFVSVRAVQEQPWQRQANNELMLRLMEAGAIPPRLAVAQMSFEGRDAILREIAGVPAEEPARRERLPYAPDLLAGGAAL